MERDQNSTQLAKVKTWLERQGYPVEFRTAEEFKRAGFQVFQGTYAGEQGSDFREVDVLARVPLTVERVHFYFEYVVECKWCRDKPWVVFTSAEAAMSPAACIAQTIGSELGNAISHCLAGERDLHSLGLFACNSRAGFGGRQAFSDQQDRFYSTVQSAVTKAGLIAKEFDARRRPSEMPPVGGVALPLIVLEGGLLEAYYDPKTETVELREVQSIRLYWRGAAKPGSYIVPIDIVTLSELPKFIAERRKEISLVLARTEIKVQQLLHCYGSRSLKPLTIEPAARGYLGVPPLLRELREMKTQDPAAGKKVDG